MTETGDVTNRAGVAGPGDIQDTQRAFLCPSGRFRTLNVVPGVAISSMEVAAKPRSANRTHPTGIS